MFYVLTKEEYDALNNEIVEARNILAEKTSILCKLIKNSKEEMCAMSNSFVKCNDCDLNNLCFYGQKVFPEG